MWNARQPLVRWATRGALVDLAMFALSFIFLGGAHGPIGPLVVLAANYPVYYLVHLFFETAPTSELLQLLLMIVIVTVNGALYGIVVGFAVHAADRRQMRRGRESRSSCGGLSLIARPGGGVGGRPGPSGLNENGMTASINAAPVLRSKGVLGDLLIVTAGNVLCLALLALGTFVVMRTSSEGRLMNELAEASNDPAARAAVLDRYEDPYGMVIFWGNWLLTLVCGLTAAIVGAIVGALVWHRAFWIPILSVLPLAASPLFTPSYATGWFRAAGWGAIAWAAATLVSRWRPARRYRPETMPSRTR